jgi:hypothetical protein
MILHDCDQGSPEWIKLRLGIPTASEFDNIITPSRGELSASRHAYMNRLVAEALTGVPTESFIETEWMARGKQLEAQAASEYEFQEDVTTQIVGFMTTDDGQAGASPDRIVLDVDGKVRRGLEIKCPAPQTQIGYWRFGFGLSGPESKSDKYKVQVQGQMYVGNLDGVDRWSYHPQFPRVLDRVQRDECFIIKLARALAEFNEERLDLIKQLRATGMFDEPAPAKTPIDVAYQDEMAG